MVDFVVLSSRPTSSRLRHRERANARAFLSFAHARGGGRRARSRAPAKLNKTICSKANNGIRFTCE